jgi:polar amino acid transport system permease protein/polar amino acid transport system substrate-binding protein
MRAAPAGLAITVAGALALGLGGCGGGAGGDTLAAIHARGELVWGGDLQGGEPYIYEDPADHGHVIGFEVDIMDALARRLGVHQRMAQHNWSNLVPSLERGDFDVAMNGLEATSDRQDRILLSRPYYVYAETLAVRTGSRYRSLDDLRGRRVGTLNQTYAFDLLRARPVELVVYEGDEEPYLDLAAGRLDGVLLDDVVADRYGCAMKGVTCLPGDVARGTYVIGLRKGDAKLKAALDAALGQMIADGELERILRRWNLWNRRQTEPPPPVSPSPDVSRTFDGGQLRMFVSAAGVTLGLSVAAFLLAVPVGLLLAVGRVYGGPIARAAARVYIELFRGTPVLLQLYVLYYGLAPYWNLGPIEAAILGLGLNYGAYEAEVYRGALLAIPRGQTEAAKALGLGPSQTLRRVLLPQALRLALPAMTNDFVSLLKDSSLVSAIAVIELTKRMTIAAVDLRGWLVPGLACAALYLALSFPLSELARRLERRLARDQRPAAL